LILHKLSIELKADWYTAQMNCKLEDMELISIETKEEQEAIAEELSSLNFTAKRLQFKVYKKAL
jgi:hypothetical protein